MGNLLKVLVVGGYGQLGKQLQTFCHDECAIKFTFCTRDQLDATKPLSKHSVWLVEWDVILNCAAYTNVDKAEIEKQECFLVNAKCVEELSALALHCGAFLIHISSDYVFDGRKSGPYVETDEPSPINYYGYSKLAGERVLIGQNVPGLIIRTSWLYSGFKGNFFTTMLSLGKTKSSVRVVNDQIGTPTSCFDLSRFIIARLSDREYLNSSVASKETTLVHFSGLNVCSWADFAARIFDLAGLPCRVIGIPSDEYQSIAVRPAQSVLDNGKAISLFSHTHIDLDLGITNALMSQEREERSL